MTNRAGRRRRHKRHKRRTLVYKRWHALLHAIEHRNYPWHQRTP